MSIKSICKTDPVTIDRDAELKIVATLMQQKHVGSIIVTDTYKGKKFLRVS